MTSKIGKHVRVPWASADPQTIHAHCRWDELKGTYRTSGKIAARGIEQYNRAKHQFDMAAAVDLVDQLVRREAIDQIVEAVIAANKPALVVVPHPEYDPYEPSGDPSTITNALPFALAAKLAAALGCEVDEEIVEIARPGRTKLTRFPRFIWQPAFQGVVRPDRAYILADDNCTLGGTFAMLRHHIVANGGTVAAVTALSNSDGTDCRFPVDQQTVGVLLSLYGSDISPFWREEIGHEIQSLTDGEANFLREWGEARGAGSEVFQQLRDRIAKAKGQAR